MLRLKSFSGSAVFFLAGLMATASSVLAQSESFHFDVPTMQVSYPSPLVVDGTLPLFDSSLGTLTGVQFTLSATDTPVIQVYNATGVSQNFDFASFSANLSIQSSNNNGTSSTSVSSIPSAGPSSGTAQPGANSFPGDSESESNSTVILPTQFSLYEGSGGMTFPVSLSFTETNPVITGGDAGPGVYFGGAINAASTLTVKYTYTPAPEPSAILLLALGMVALLGWRFLPAGKLLVR